MRADCAVVFAPWVLGFPPDKDSRNAVFSALYLYRFGGRKVIFIGRIFKIGSFVRLSVELSQFDCF